MNCHSYFKKAINSRRYLVVSTIFYQLLKHYCINYLYIQETNQGETYTHSACIPTRSARAPACCTPCRQSSSPSYRTRVTSSNPPSKSESTWNGKARTVYYSIDYSLSCYGLVYYYSVVSYDGTMIVKQLTAQTIV